MKFSIFLKYFIFIIVMFLVTNLCDAAIINIPEDAETLDEGIQLASYGDIIKVNQHDVILKHIHIINKDLTIIGTLLNKKARVKCYHTGTNIDFPIDIPPESDLNVITINNSIVKFRNLEFMSTDTTSNQFAYFYGMTSPWQVISGKMIFEEVIFHGLIKVFSDIEISNSIIYGDSEYYEIYTNNSRSGRKPFPAIHIRNIKSPNIKIVNTEIRCNTEEGSRPIIIEKTINGIIRIINTNINAGMHSIHSGYDQSKTLPGSYWDATDTKKGLAGIFIIESNNTTINLQGSTSTGGYGVYVDLPVPSGPGIEILNSENIIINDGTSIGGDGRVGGLRYTGAIVDSNDGGNGLYITNSSVHLYNHKAIGGKGGEGDPEHDILPGQDGEPIYQDENSEVIIETNVHDWMLYTK